MLPFYKWVNQSKGKDGWGLAKARESWWEAEWASHPELS